MSTWKPCDRLIPSDFVRTAVWTTDLQRAARDERFDDTWVRPARAGDALDDEVFARATLLDRDGRPIPRSVLAMRAGKRRGANPIPTALVALGPYTSTPIEDHALPLNASPALARLAPISYEVDVKVGSTHWRAKGRIVAQTAQPSSAPADDGEAQRRALIEAALARVTANPPEKKAPSGKKPVSGKQAVDSKKAQKPAKKAPAKKPAAKKPARKKR